MTHNFTQYDKSNLLSVTNNMTEESLKAFENAQAISENYQGINNILVSGMGGSCISGDLLKTYLYDKSLITLLVNRSSVLPNFVNEKSLCVFISYSGNTQETLNCYKQAIAKSAQCIVITSGGQIEKIAQENNHKIVKITGTPKMPRAAVGELFYSLIGVLSSFEALNINSDEIKKSLACLSEIKDKQIIDNSTMFELANKSKGKKLAVFGISPVTETIALRWKNQLNENAKATVLFNTFPELTHNEIVNLATENLDNYFIIILRDKSEDSFVKKQVDMTISILDKAHIEEISIDKDTLLERQMSLVYLGDYFSIYHALINGIDPTPIESIMTLKEKMKD